MQVEDGAIFNAADKVTGGPTEVSLTLKQVAALMGDGDGNLIRDATAQARPRGGALPGAHQIGSWLGIRLRTEKSADNDNNHQAL